MLCKKAVEYLKQFELKLRCETDSKATIDNYLSAASSFLAFCHRKEGDPATLLQQYIVWALNKHSARSVNLKRAGIVKFFFLVKGLKISTQDVPRKRQPKQLPKIADKDVISSLISSTNNIKHRLEMSLMFGCGLRLSEVSHLKRKNIIASALPWRLWLEDTKGNRHRIVPVPESIRMMLGDFISRMAPEEYVFKGEGGKGHISNKSISNVVKNAGNREGVYLHPHMLRHSFATEQISSGQNVFKVQGWLGHGSIKTTMAYVHLSEKVKTESTDLLANGNYKNVS